MCELMKFTKKLGLSIFFMAKAASDGILGEFFIMFKARSFKLSNNAKDSFDIFLRRFSSNSSILATKYGSADSSSTNLSLFFPCIIIVLLPSGILSILMI